MKTLFAIRTVCILMISIAFSNVSNAAYPVWVMPAQIKFNYEEGNTHDALTIQKRDDNGNYIPVPSPEWSISNVQNNVPNEMFAYVKSQSNPKIQVQLYSNCDTMHLLINLTVTSGSGIGEIQSFFVPNYLAWDWIELELEGSTPPSIGVKEFTWEWKIFAIPINTNDFCAAWETTSTTHEYYNLYDAPLAPCEVPKIFMLDYVCDWADGNTTADGICTDILENGFKEHYNWVRNCHQLSSDLIRYLTTLGISAILQRWSSIDASYEYDMIYQRTKIIDPVGSEFDNDSIDWPYHQWVEVETESGIYQLDPSTAVIMQGDWGDYEDADTTFMRYKTRFLYEPDKWINNQPGQSIGCEGLNHREHKSGSELTLEDYHGPDH